MCLSALAGLSLDRSGKLASAKLLTHIAAVTTRASRPEWSVKAVHAVNLSYIAEG